MGLESERVVVIKQALLEDQVMITDEGTIVGFAGVTASTDNTANKPKFRDKKNPGIADNGIPDTWSADKAPALR